MFWAMEGPPQPGAGDTSHVIDRALPCLGCEYDLRATAPDAEGWVTCPECGSRVDQLRLIENIDEGYITSGRVARHLFFLPLILTAALTLTCTGGGLFPELYAVPWVAMGGFLLLALVLSREVSAAVVARLTRSPIRRGRREGCAYWATLLTITLLVMGVTLMYLLVTCVGLSFLV